MVLPLPRLPVLASDTRRKPREEAKKGAAMAKERDRPGKTWVLSARRRVRV